MFLNRIFHSRRGQGLFEVIIGIGVIMAGTVGTITLISSTVQAGRTVSQKVVAASLAREGIEVIRNARDSNWLRIQANEDTVTDDSSCVSTPAGPTCGIQLPKSFEGIFNESTPWHNVVPEFGVSSNTWVVSPVSNPPADPFNANCGSKKCSQIFLDATNGGYFQDVSPSGTESESRFRRLVSLNPICRRDFDADDIPDIGTYGDTLATEAVVAADNTTCDAASKFVLVGLQVISRVTWDGETNCPSAKCFELEDRLYNWKYVK